MNIIIHRGVQQIGGCVTEIKTNTTRLFIDFGSELPAPNKTPSDIQIYSLTYGQPDCSAVLFTHYHGDHVGMINNILPNIPLYIGDTSKKILLELYKRIKKDTSRIESMKSFEAAKSFEIGDIKITPFSVDHSAYDAYMFLVEADGKKILHTGDYRSHGFRGKGLLPTLQKYVGQVDILITEGTMLSRTNENVLTEHQLSQKAKNIIRENKYTFILCSSTNIDRIAAFHAVIPRGRYVICDTYQKHILDIAEKQGRVKSNLYSFKNVFTYGDNLFSKMQHYGCCMYVRATPYFKKIIEKFDKKQSIIVYSMWKGYLDNKDSGIRDFLTDFHWIYLHTSGHATKKCILKVISTVNPRIGVIPIHTENSQELLDSDIQSKIIFLKDSECYTL